MPKVDWTFSKCLGYLKPRRGSGLVELDECQLALATDSTQSKSLTLSRIIQLLKY